MPDQTTPTARIFKTGATRIVEDESMRGLSVEDVRGILKRTYPEIAHATVRETTQADGTVLVEYLPQPGRKG
ncbi:MAG: hypothetical protein F9K46_00400 [Anaerolineae bacterium]|nr:MAG: hypothetical protein F9K46_00400 [Anaerolineae bacterium]